MGISVEIPIVAPTIKRTGSLGTPDEEKAGYSYEVTLIGRKTLIPVSI